MRSYQTFSHLKKYLILTFCLLNSEKSRYRLPCYQQLIALNKTTITSNYKPEPSNYPLRINQLAPVARLGVWDVALSPSHWQSRNSISTDNHTRIFFPSKNCYRALLAYCCHKLDVATQGWQLAEDCSSAPLCQHGSPLPEGPNPRPPLALMPRVIASISRAGRTLARGGPRIVAGAFVPESWGIRPSAGSSALDLQDGARKLSAPALLACRFVGREWCGDGGRGVFFLLLLLQSPMRRFEIFWFGSFVVSFSVENVWEFWI